MRHLLASAVALCALGACISNTAPYTKDDYVEHAKRTKIGKVLGADKLETSNDSGNDTLLSAVATSAFTYVMDNAFFDHQDALAITLIDNLGDLSLRCRHAAPWMYGILELVTKTDADLSKHTNVVSAFKLFDRNCINISIFADGPAPLDAVLSNISHLNANKAGMLMEMISELDVSESYAPAVTLKLAQSMFVMKDGNIQTKQDLYDAYFLWLNKRGASNWVANKSMTTSPAVNPALVINLATMYNYGTTVSFFDGMHSIENPAYMNQAKMYLLALASYNKLSNDGKNMVDAILTGLGMVGFKEVDCADLRNEDAENCAEKLESHKKTLNNVSQSFMSAEFLKNYMNHLPTYWGKANSTSVHPLASFKYMHDGQFSLKEYALFKAARSEANEISNILDTYKVFLTDISPMAWEVFLQMVDAEKWNTYMTRRSHQNQMYNSDFKSSLISNQLFKAPFTPADRVKDALSTARCLAAAENLKSDYKLPELSSFCALPSDEASIVGRMRAYRRTLRNPLRVLVPSSHGHWPDAFWLHDMGCFFPVLGMRLAVYYAAGASVLAALVLLLVRCCNRRIDKTKARYALPRPADE